jgi:HlyD family secretion protein
VSNNKNVLLVPNAALRWSPKPEEIASEFRNVSQGEKASDSTATEGVVWTQQGSFVRPIKVRLGQSDSSKTEVSGDEIKEGLRVITGQQQQQTAETGTTNPFVPQIRRSRPGSGTGSGGSTGGSGGSTGGTGGSGSSGRGRQN